MKIEKILYDDKAVEKIYYWYTGIGKYYRYQINYTPIVFYKNGTVKTLDEIRKIEKQLNVKAKKIKIRRKNEK